MTWDRARRKPGPVPCPEASGNRVHGGARSPGSSVCGTRRWAAYGLETTPVRTGICSHDATQGSNHSLGPPLPRRHGGCHSGHRRCHGQVIDSGFGVRRPLQGLGNGATRGRRGRRHRAQCPPIEEHRARRQSAGPGRAGPYGQGRRGGGSGRGQPRIAGLLPYEAPGLPLPGGAEGLPDLLPGACLEQRSAAQRLRSERQRQPQGHSERGVPGGVPDLEQPGLHGPHRVDAGLQPPAPEGQGAVHGQRHGLRRAGAVREGDRPGGARVPATAGARHRVVPRSGADSPTPAPTARTT